MTISTTINKVSYSGNGATTTFAYTFKVFAATDLKVYIRDASGTETLQTITTHYTVSNVGNASGGNVDFVTPPSGTDKVIIQRVLPLTQTFDYVLNDPFPSDSHEDGLDKLTLQIQQVQEEVDRSIKASVTNEITSTEFTIDAATRANKLFGFDSSGNISVTTAVGTYRGNWAASTAYSERDIVKDTDTNNIFICNNAHTSSGAQPLTTNTDSAKWDLLVDAASATSSAAAAAASASASASSAATSATHASTAEGHKDTATTKAAEASASAVTAAGHVSTASAHTTDASEHKQTAERWANLTGSTVTDVDTGVDSGEYSAKHYANESATHLDTFQDRFFGAMNVSTHPATDLDGNAILTGAQYYNSSSSSLGGKTYVYNGSSWQEVSPTETATDVVNASTGGTFSGPITATIFNGDGSNLTGLSTGVVLYEHINGTNARSTSTITFTVTVGTDANGNNRYLINGLHSGIEWTEGQTYNFNLEDSSLSGHDFEIGTAVEGGGLTSGSGGYTKTGTDGSSGASASITFDASTASNLYVFCETHSGMGFPLTEYGTTTNLTSDNQAFTDMWTGPFGWEKTWVHPNQALPFGETVICGSGINFYMTELSAGFDKKSNPYIVSDTTISSAAVYPGKLEVINGTLTINNSINVEVLDLDASNMVIT